MRANMSSVAESEAKSDQGVVTDVITPTTAPDRARTGRSAGDRPTRWAIAPALHGPDELVHRPGPGLRHGERQLGRLAELRHLVGAERLERLFGRGADRRDRREVGRLTRERS